MHILAVTLCLFGTCAIACAAERNIFESAKHIFAVMDLQRNILSECAQQDPANKQKFSAEIARYRQQTKALDDKVRQLIIAETPSNDPAASLAAIERWSATESQRNIKFQLLPQHRAQFMQKCDYVINPDSRKRYGATNARHNEVVGSPDAQYPAEVRAIFAWKP